MNPTMLFPLRQLSLDACPSSLREIPDCPERLFIRGELPAASIYLCVVGSRSISPYGRRVCASLITGLARAPVTIVSGLAIGTDAYAHEAALDAGLPTIAVLPSSCDDASIYPRMHAALAQRILHSGGALVSEYPPTFKPHPYSFAARNRIMAGLSKAVLIIEAGEKSGTLITARLALEYYREVLAVPHELGKETGAGVNRLIREGATLVRSGDDIRQALGIATETTQDTLPTDLTESEILVLETLTEALEKDVLIERTELSAQEINIALSSLLIRGVLVERLGKIERI